jgi:hypothetical protein
VDSIMKNVREPYVTAFAISLPEVRGGCGGGGGVAWLHQRHARG